MRGLYMEKKGIEKIEILKGTRSYIYTGIIVSIVDGWVEIHTTIGEKLKFRLEQVVQRLSIGDSDEK